MLVQRAREFVSTVVCIALVLGTGERSVSQERHRRAKLPHFDKSEVERVFFDDLFQHLVGKRPDSGVPASTAAPAPASKDGLKPSDGSKGFAWTGVISPVTLEDEVKSLKLDLDRVVTTPGEFAGRGHEAARLDYSLLAVLFGIIDQYDGEVRWKDSAARARDLFSHTAANLKAGGSIQVYNESKLRKQDLSDLILGSRLPARDEATEAGWKGVVDRSPVMQLLETRLESNLKQWTATPAEFQTKSEKIGHEAEITAALAAALARPGMDDADDPQYCQFAASLEKAARQMVQAVKSQDAAAARSAMTRISRSCVDCHEDYR